MSLEVDVRKVTRYPPEAFISAKPFDLLAEDNTIAAYVVPDEYLIIFNGLGLTRTSGLRFWINSDGYSEVFKMGDLGAAKGLDWSEDIKIPSANQAELHIYSGSAVSGYASWHRVLVMRKTPLLKHVLGLPMEPEEKSLVEKYGVPRSLKMRVPKPYDMASGIEIIKTVAESMSSSGTVARIVCPEGMKLILKEIAVDRPAVNQATLTIERDGVDVMELDLGCLPGLEYGVQLRVVALEKLEVTIDISAGAPHEVRLSYGIGRLTIPEKVKWGLKLTAEEREIAESEDVYDKVEAGIL